MSIYERDPRVIPYSLLDDESKELDDEIDESEEFDESLSVYEAAEIWASHGKDEDYMFGYTEEELEDAL
jgi:hypothetical protein